MTGCSSLGVPSPEAVTVIVWISCRPVGWIIKEKKRRGMYASWELIAAHHFYIRYRIHTDLCIIWFFWLWTSFLHRVGFLGRWSFTVFSHKHHSSHLGFSTLVTNHKKRFMIIKVARWNCIEKQRIIILLRTSVFSALGLPSSTGLLSSVLEDAVVTITWGVGGGVALELSLVSATASWAWTRRSPGWRQEDRMVRKRSTIFQ